MPARHIGVSGTVTGASPPQLAALRREFEWIEREYGHHGIVLHHGCAVGVDQQAHEIALELEDDPGE